MGLIDIHGLQVDGRLHGLDLAVAPGQLLGVLGPNGAGKSTLLHCLAGLQPYHGEILFEGRPLGELAPTHRAQRIGFLPQRCQSAWALSVRDVIGLGRLPWRDQAPEPIARAAAATRVEPWLERRVDQLSGGEQARVWLARVLAGEPTLLLADEPAASLDIQHQQHLMRVLRDYAQGERSVLVSVHDLSLAARYCDQLCLLAEGRVLAWGPPRRVLTPANLQQAFEVDTLVDLDAHPPIILPR